MISLLFCSASLFVVSLLVLIRGWRSPPKCLPPSPRGLPVAGNALQLPAHFLFHKLCEWQKQLGDIYTISAFRQRILVLGSATVASDILDRTASSTSGRPSYAMPAHILRDKGIALAPYGESWRRHRRVAHEAFNVRAVATYMSIQEKGAAELVQTLVESHEDLHYVLTRFTGITVWRALYGQTTSSMEGRIQRMKHMVALVLKLASPTASIVNLFPVLLRLRPSVLIPWKRYGDGMHYELDEFALKCIRDGASAKNDTTVVATFMKIKEGNSDLTENQLAWTSMMLFGAGVETTAYTLHFFILAMVLYPDVAKKAQQVLGSVVGSRPPTFQDRDQLVYIDAIVKEVLRWRTIIPLGLPHLATEEFAYGKYIIPKGTFIMPNIWHINHDPDVFPEPDQFRPERFLDSNDKLKTLQADLHDGLLAFGYGRRICPGRYFASNMLFITVAYLLWSFDFSKEIDENGEEITPSSMVFRDENVLIYPAPFPYLLKPRRDLPEIFDVPKEKV